MKALTFTEDWGFDVIQKLIFIMERAAMGITVGRTLIISIGECKAHLPESGQNTPSQLCNTMYRSLNSAGFKKKCLGCHLSDPSSDAMYWRIGLMDRKILDRNPFLGS